MEGNKLREEETEKSLQEKKLHYFIQMLDIKEDNNMTRIYSAITNSNFINPNPIKK